MLTIPAYRIQLGREVNSDEKKKGRCESAGINRYRVGDERALHERSS